MALASRVLGLTLILGAAPSGVARGQTVAIQGGTIITMAGPRMVNGTVLMRDGKIVAVGARVDVPVGARVIDARGRFVMPGIVDPITYFGVPPEYLNDDEPITPEMRILHNYVPWRVYTDRGGPVRITELLSGGVTTQYIGPGDASVIGGQGVVVKTAGRSYASTIVKDPAAMDITIGERPALVFRSRQREPSTRAAVLTLLRTALTAAREYAGGMQRRDLRTEALQLVLARKIPARVQANRPEDIRDAIRLAEELGFDLVIDGGSFAHEMRAELAAKRVPVVLGPPSRSYAWTQDSPNPSEFPEPEERAAGWLARAGVKVAIGSFARGHYAHNEAITGKWLLLDAMLASAYGLPEDGALRAITINAAQILGVAERVGSLEPGKDADVVILSGPPSSILSRVEQVFVDGVLSYTRSTN